MSAIQIVKVDDSGHFNYSKASLQKVLEKIDDELPVSVISITGVYRSGKSFLMDMLIDYLEHDASDQINLKGFVCRGGEDRCTTGLWVWSKPYLLKDKNGNSFTLLLIDSQGLFDMSTNQSTTMSIFGLTLLFSTNLIFNIEKRLQEDYLQYLAYFSQYAKAKTSNLSTNLSTNLNKTSPFQQLTFLIRDWDYSENYPSLETSTKYLEKMLTGSVLERQDIELQKTRSEVKSCFDKIDLWCLPHPGFDVASIHFDGIKNKLRPEFVDSANEFFNFIKSNIQTHRYVNTGGIPDLFENYVHLFNQTSDLPKPETLLALTVKLQQASLIERYKNYYRQKLTIATKSRHQILVDEITNSYNQIPHLGSSESVKQTLETLLQQIEIIYKERQNELQYNFWKLLSFLPLISILKYFAVSCLSRYLIDITCGDYFEFCVSTSYVLSVFNTLFMATLLVILLCCFSLKSSYFWLIVDLGVSNLERFKIEIPKLIENTNKWLKTNKNKVKLD